MTNLEKYKKDIEFCDYANKAWGISTKGEITPCSRWSDCEHCKFNIPGTSCNVSKLKWLKEEYEEPEVDWSKVAVDTPILVSADGKQWFNRYFARYHDGLVWAWEDGRTSWTDCCNCMTTWQYAKLTEKEE